ncbi:MAG: peptidase M28 [Ignavibacteria bacterium]|nr:MAG: peptidase M28 [Ignavibacteria bacterium]KAF0161874.1 MAG: peptidase M28 [Ignavibacteria bacterium]
MKKLCTIFALILFTINITAQTDPTIQTIINKVSIDTLMSYLGEICGDKQITINNSPTRILSRNRYSTGNAYMPYYLIEKFEKFGLVALQQNFMTDGQNVYAIQNGRKSDQYVIICAHYDNMPSSGIAPGADDNGSGTVAVLEAARILSKYKFDFTIIYALWDLEEYGLHGSNYYAQEASFRGDKIAAVINLDMIAWDSNNDFKAEVHSRNVSTTLELGNLVQDVNRNYSVGLNMFTSTPGTNASDHASFWRYNYPAVLLIESMGDFNPYYHKVTDDISKINKPYFERMSKLAIAVTAVSAVPVSAASVAQNLPSEFKLNQNYPNPFNPSTVISYRISEPSHVTLKVYDVLGREVATLVDEHKQPGSYKIVFNPASSIKNPASGIYFYRLVTPTATITKKMVLTK